MKLNTMMAGYTEILTESPVATQTLLDISHLDPTMRRILIDCISSTGLHYGRDFFIQSDELFIANYRLEGPQLAILASYNLTVPNAAKSADVYHVGIPEDSMHESTSNHTELDTRGLSDQDLVDAMKDLEKQGLVAGEDFELDKKDGWILNTKYDYPQVEVFNKYGIEEDDYYPDDDLDDELDEASGELTKAKLKKLILSYYDGITSMMDDAVKFNIPAHVGGKSMVSGAKLPIMLGRGYFYGADKAKVELKKNTEEMFKHLGLEYKIIDEGDHYHGFVGGAPSLSSKDSFVYLIVDVIGYTALKEGKKYPEGSWKVSYSDKNYNSVDKIFKNDPQGAAGATETKARNYAKTLSDKHAKDKYGFIRGDIRVTRLTEDKADTEEYWDEAYANWRMVRGDYLDLKPSIEREVDTIDELFYDIITFWPKVSKETLKKLKAKLREIGAEVHVFLDNINEGVKKNKYEEANTEWKRIRKDFVDKGDEVFDVVNTIDELFYDIVTFWPEVSNDTMIDLKFKLEELGVYDEVFGI